jgi:hypothetical protein
MVKFRVLKSRAEVKNAETVHIITRMEESFAECTAKNQEDDYIEIRIENKDLRRNAMTEKGTLKK